MQRMAFHEWLEDRVQEVPDTTTLVLVIAKSGESRVPRHNLLRRVHLSPDLLLALVAAGQVVVSRVNGQMVYRATM
jgi:hypothetical protein